MSLLQNSNAIETGGYNIANSLRFQSASSTYLARTPASNGNRQKFTFSFWAKRGTLSAGQEMYFVNSGGGNFAQISWNSSNQIDITSADSSVAICQLVTTPVYRDPSAWYHIVFAIDTTQATASNRVKIYVNGSQVTALATATYPSLNYNFQLNNTTAQNIGRPSTGTFDGYLAEYNFVDAQALEPSSFGETNTLTGQWVAKKYTGTYGTNGFYLPFSNGTSTTTLGYDSSGNSNNWTLNNFTRSAGVSDCWMYDVPSGNGSAGTQPNSNYCVLNPLNYINGSAPSKANLYTANGGTSVETRAGGTLGITAGKWYFEDTVGGTYCNFQVGVHDALSALSTTTNYATYGFDGRIRNGTTDTAYGNTVASGDKVGVAIDMDSGKIWFSKNGTWQGSGDPVAGTNAAFTTLAGATVIPFFVTYNNGSGTTTHDFNGGQRSFSYTPPSGFKALCTANLPASTIVKGNQYMDATLFTGTATANQTQTITNAAGFSPDLVWVKSRSLGGSNHMLSDSVRGFGTNCMNSLFTDSTSAELSDLTNASLPTGYGAIFSLNSNGFTLKAGSTNGNQVNASGQTYVAWQWDAGSSTVTNTSGSISSQVRANPTAGVSIVTFTATGANSTVGHGLGVAPKMVITKSRNNTFVWYTWHTALAGNEYLELSTTVAKGTSATLWNSTIPTSSVLSFGSSYPNGTNLVAYCFAEIAGFSKFGSYTGNGSADGTFVYTNLTARFILIKRTDTTGNWIMWDTARNTYNALGEELYPNLSNAAATATDLDVLSNGFKLRSTNAAFNASGGTYIYACFASNPFSNSNGF